MEKMSFFLPQVNFLLVAENILKVQQADFN